MNPGLNAVGGLVANFAANATPTIYMYGTAVIYYSLPATAALNTTGFQGDNVVVNSTLLIRYD